MGSRCREKLKWGIAWRVGEGQGGWNVGSRNRAAHSRLEREGRTRVRMGQSLRFILNSLECPHWRSAKSEHLLGRHCRIQRDNGGLDWPSDRRWKETNGLKIHLKNELELLIP